MGTTNLRVLAFSFDGQSTMDAICKKIGRIGLEVVDEEEKNASTTTSFEFLLELPRIGADKEIIKHFHIVNSFPESLR